MQLRDTYRELGQCVVGIESRDHEGTIAIGTAFHIGDGFYLTARHVIEGREITGVVFGPGTPRFGRIYSAHFPDDRRIDLAVFSTDLTDSCASKGGDVESDGPFQGEMSVAVPLGGHLDEWINDSLVLMPVLLMGFPPVPTTRDAVLLAVTGEVNAVVHTYWSPHPYFVVSSTARGGFSGGPVITEQGWLLGVLVESLDQEQKKAEPGFAVALSVEPIYALLSKLKIAPRANRAMCFLLRDVGSDPEYFSEMMTPNEFQAICEWGASIPGAPPPKLVGRPCAPLIAAKLLWQESPVLLADELDAARVERGLRVSAGALGSPWGSSSPVGLGLAAWALRRTPQPAV